MHLYASFLTYPAREPQIRASAGGSVGAKVIFFIVNTKNVVNKLIKILENFAKSED